VAFLGEYFCCKLGCGRLGHVFLLSQEVCVHDCRCIVYTRNLDHFWFGKKSFFFGKLVHGS